MDRQCSRVGMGLGLVVGLAALCAMLAFQFGGEARSQARKNVIGRKIVIDNNAVAINSEIHFSAAEHDNYRSDLLNVWAVYSELAELLDNDTIRTLANQSIASVEQLTEGELDSLMKTGADFQPLQVSLEDLHAVVTENFSRTPAEPDGGGASIVLPSANYASICGSTRFNTTAIFAARTVLKIAEGVWSVASRGCDQVVVLLGAGGNPSLACIPVDAVLVVARIVFESLEFCDDSIDSAEIEGAYDRLGHIHGDLETVDSTVISIETKVDILDSKVTSTESKVDILNVKIDTLLVEVERLRRQNCEIIRLLHVEEEDRKSNIDVCAGEEGFPYRFKDDDDDDGDDDDDDDH